jgi:hypothetical protein
MLVAGGCWEAAEGIAKSLEGLPTWKPEHSEKVEGGIIRHKLWLMRDRLHHFYEYKIPKVSV